MSPASAHSLQPEIDGTTYTVRCRCGWSVSGLAHIDFREPLELAAYEHLTGSKLDPADRAARALEELGFALPTRGGVL